MGPARLAAAGHPLYRSGIAASRRPDLAGRHQQLPRAVHGRLHDHPRGGAGGVRPLGGDRLQPDAARPGPAEPGRSPARSARRGGRRQTDESAAARPRPAGAVPPHTVAPTRGETWPGVFDGQSNDLRHLPGRATLRRAQPAVAGVPVYIVPRFRNIKGTSGPFQYTHIVYMPLGTDVRDASRDSISTRRPATSSTCPTSRTRVQPGRGLRVSAVESAWITWKYTASPQLQGRQCSVGGLTWLSPSPPIRPATFTGPTMSPPDHRTCRAQRRPARPRCATGRMRPPGRAYTHGWTCRSTPTYAQPRRRRLRAEPKWHEVQRLRVRAHPRRRRRRLQERLPAAAGRHLAEQRSVSGYPHERQDRSQPHQGPSPRPGRRPGAARAEPAPALRGPAAALAALYEEVGFARSLLAYELPDGRLKLIDGHLRQSMDPDMEVDVEVLDVDDAEARACCCPSIRWPSWPTTTPASWTRCGP